MCATHDAKIKPWTKNTAVTATRALRASGGPRNREDPIPTASCAPYVDTGTSQFLNSLFVCLGVGHQDIDHSDIADVPESHPADFGTVSDCDDSSRCARSCPFHNRFRQVVGGDASSDIEPAEAHDVGVKAQFAKCIGREVAHE